MSEKAREAFEEQMKAQLPSGNMMVFHHVEGGKSLKEIAYDAKFSMAELLSVLDEVTPQNEEEAEDFLFAVGDHINSAVSKLDLIRTVLNYKWDEYCNAKKEKKDE